MVPDPFGRAIADHHRSDREEPLLQRDGAETLEHPISDFYFGSHDPEQRKWSWADAFLDGPLLDMGAGAGREALFYQERYDVVAIDVSEHLVETMRDRGVDDARVADMFEVRQDFSQNRFESALSHGTQLGLAGSMTGLRRFLDDLAVVTTPDASVVLDGYDPTADGIETLLGYRTDAAEGLAYRVFSFEYGGTHGDILLFRLFSPDRLRTAANDTGWVVRDVERPQDGDRYYMAALQKR